MAIKREKRYLIDNPDLMAEWDWEKNDELGLDPATTSCGMHIIAYWVCGVCGNHYKMRVDHRATGHGCKKCGIKKAKAKINADKLARGKSVDVLYPELVEEWINEFNGDHKLSEFTQGSHFLATWKCKTCGKIYKAAIYNRIKGKRCPDCSLKNRVNKRLANNLVKLGSLADKRSDLLIDWDYSKNKISPDQISVSSNKTVHWRCHKCGYEWSSSLYKRSVENHSCPACSNKVVTPNNNLAVTNPEVLKHWDYAKNQRTPEDFTSGSNKKAWWICEKGHSYCQTISSYVHGKACPYCSNQKVLRGFNDLATTRQDLLPYWHPTKNTNITPYEITSGSSSKKVWWICDKGHEYQMTPANKAAGQGCPICAKQAQTSFPEQAIFFYLKQATEAKNRYKLDGKIEIDIYLPVFNIGIEYDGFLYHSSEASKYNEEKKNMYCAEHGIRLIRIKEVKEDMADSDTTIYCINDGRNYSYLTDVINKLFSLLGIELQTAINVDNDAPSINNQYIFNEKQNSLGSVYPDLAKEWDYKKNGILTPSMISSHSGRKVWWKCAEGHSYQASPDNRAKGNGCPFCSGNKVLVGFNDLGTTNPELLKEWDFDRNNKSPYELSKGSHYKAWWKCNKCGYEWQDSISNRSCLKRGCSKCQRKGKKK